MSELLCFVTDKCNVLPVDDVVKICVDFYSESEIINARSALDSTGVRLPKRNGLSDRLRLTMEDIVKCVLDPSVHVASPSRRDAGFTFRPNDGKKSVVIFYKFYYKIDNT